MSWLSAPTPLLRGCLLVISLTCLVQWLAPSSVLLAQPEMNAAVHTTGCTVDGNAPPPLPAPVREMRDAILAAVQSGDIEDLRAAVEWNELRPHVADEAVDDPIAYWKRISGDGEGREVLAVLGEILECGYAALPIGNDVENNLVYVWPALAEADLTKLTPQQEVALYRLVSPDQVKTMREAKRWQWWRLAIGADGTWHAFHKAE